jgi:hypothetical protein
MTAVAAHAGEEILPVPVDEEEDAAARNVGAVSPIPYKR